MNLAYLGDALDHWKGSLFESLVKARALRNLAVDAMASDLARWESGDFGVYAGLLRVPLNQIIRHKAPLEDRVSYFGEISHEGDLFLDPDIGIATPGTRAKADCYVKPMEIKQLLGGVPNRLVIVYQHVRGKRASSRVDEVIGALQQDVGGFSWVSYESPTVAMLFLSRQTARTEPVAKQLGTMLGRHALGRVRYCSI